MLKNVNWIKIRKTMYVSASTKIRKNIVCLKKDYLWNPAAFSYKNIWILFRYLTSIIDVSVITCDESIKKQKLFL